MSAARTAPREPYCTNGNHQEQQQGHRDWNMDWNLAFSPPNPSLSSTVSSPLSSDDVPVAEVFVEDVDDASTGFVVVVVDGAGVVSLLVVCVDVVGGILGLLAGRSVFNRNTSTPQTCNDAPARSIFS